MGFEKNRAGLDLHSLPSSSLCHSHSPSLQSFQSAISSTPVFFQKTAIQRVLISNRDHDPRGGLPGDPR